MFGQGFDCTFWKRNLIKLNLENLDALSKLITGETSGMLAECVIFLNESFNISENENKILQIESNNYQKDLRIRLTYFN